MTTYRKKLIEVALPLEAINAASIPEKSPRPGHPSTLHLWWARRPLAACRAVLFASLVDDPSSHPEKFPTEEAQETERQRLFRIIQELVKWENSNNQQVLQQARAEILKSTNGHPPPVLDPFCGGGSIPLEAQRLGLEAHGSDLNPVAVLITKALIEIPPKFAGKPPVNPDSRKKLDHSKTWRGAQGLAEDVRYYGQWMRDEAEKRIGHLYPKVKLPKEQGGGEATVIAWLWARTVNCPNPACGGEMPLVGSYWLCQKKHKPVWLEPQVEKRLKKVHFVPRRGAGGPPPTPKVGGRSTAFQCAYCNQIADGEYLEREGECGRIGSRLIVTIADSRGGRIYLPATDDQASAAAAATPQWRPEYTLPPYSQALPTAKYGARTLADLFTPRQTTMLELFSELVVAARERILADARASAVPDDGSCVNDGGTGALAYADAVATYLGLVVGRQANRSSAFCFWDAGSEKVQQPFAQQGINKTWDFCEANPFSGASGSWDKQLQYAAKVLEMLPVGCTPGGATQADAALPNPNLRNVVVCCDPPYYSNIGYADLSDFFYVWLRRALSSIHPSLFATLLTPKEEELVAAAYRFGGKKELARDFFVSGLSKAFGHLRVSQRGEYPLTVFYSYKQIESKGNGERIWTGWEVMLDALLTANFAVDGTWPLRTENIAALKKEKGSLATSVALACRPRPEQAPLATRREFINALKAELPVALRNLQRGSIAPVDLAQAAIGPGMAVFSRYSKVIEADGSAMRVRAALELINQTLDEVLAEQEGEFDADTRFAVTWFEQRAFDAGPFGEADVLARAKNTAVNGLEEAGILTAKAGKVRLLRPEELDGGWDPTTARRLTVWEVTHQLIRALDKDGEAGAAALLRKVGALGETARDLAYRLYGVCERKKWSQEGLAYNSLVIAWPEITRLARAERPREEQIGLGV
jgi:putative DNA methylase